MFFYTLRQWGKFVSEGNLFINYRCKNCEQWAIVALTEQEFTALKQGIPFNHVFPKEARISLKHFKQGKCKQCQT